MARGAALGGLGDLISFVGGFVAAAEAVEGAFELIHGVVWWGGVLVVSGGLVMNKYWCCWFEKVSKQQWVGRCGSLFDLRVSQWVSSVVDCLFGGGRC